MNSISTSEPSRKGRELPIMRLLTLIILSATTCPAAEDEKPLNPSVTTANQVLARAGLPALPENAKELQCYAWNGLSAGIYAMVVLKKADLTAYMSSFPAGLEKASPIPRNLLAPPIASAAWFTPGGITDGTVLYRGRIVSGAPEIFRLYADVENSRVYLYYTWNNKRTYP